MKVLAPLYVLSVLGLAGTVTTWKDVLVTYQPVFNTLAIGFVAALTYYVRKRSKESDEKIENVERKVNKVRPKPGGRRHYDPPAQEVKKD